MRSERSPQQISDYHRIRELGDAWGFTLDRLGASYRQVRWVAGPAGPLLIVEREKRYRALVALLNSGGGRQPWRAWLQLEASMPKVGRAATRAAAIAAE